MSELEPLPLEPRPTPPTLPGAVVLREDADAAIDALAADMVLHAHNCVRAFGDFHLALSGGSTPVALYTRLMIDPRYRDLPWNRTHLWIVDERRVGFDDERSNYKMISEIIVDHSGIPREQVHPMYATADDADAQYERTLRETLGWRERGHDRLDLVLLGMGSDGHTASLFPSSAALRECLAAPMFAGGEGGGGSASVPLVRINRGPEVTPPERVTMMLPFINASRFIAVLVTGKGKRAMLAQVAAATRAVGAAGGGMPPASAIDRLPILGVRPLAGDLRWYIDDDACPEAPDARG